MTVYLVVIEYGSIGDEVETEYHISDQKEKADYYAQMHDGFVIEKEMNE